MNMLSNEKVNFKSLEENIFKEMMKLGREIIQEELWMLDNLLFAKNMIKYEKVKVV